MLKLLTGLLLAGVILYLACVYGSTSFVMLGFAIALLVVLSFVLLCITTMTIKVNIDIPLMIVDKDKTFHINVIIDNKLPFGIKRMNIVVKYGKYMGKRAQKVLLKAENIPHGESEFCYKINITEAGRYDFKLSKIGIYDYLGIYHFNRFVRSECNALVLPVVDSIPVVIGDRIVNFYGDADIYDKGRAGYDPGETFDVREFRQGDSLTSVHWKMSAKKDELIVRDKSLPKACPVVLMLNLDKKCNDILLQKAATFSFSLMDNGCPYYVSWFSRTDKDLVRLRVDDEESFYEFMVRFMQDESPKPVEDLQTLYREKYRGDYWLHELLFEAGRVTLDGEQVPDEMDSELVLS